MPQVVESSDQNIKIKPYLLTTTPFHLFIPSDPVIGLKQNKIHTINGPALIKSHQCSVIPGITPENSGDKYSSNLSLQLILILPLRI